MKNLETLQETIKSRIRDIPDFPKKGILFKDITPVLKDPEVFRIAVDALAQEIAGKDIQVVVGIESRGFIFSPVLAYKLNIGFVPVRKKGKLPYRTEQASYQLEYGEATLEIHRDALVRNAREDEFFALD